MYNTILKTALNFERRKVMRSYDDDGGRRIVGPLEPSAGVLKYNKRTSAPKTNIETHLDI